LREVKGEHKEEDLLNMAALDEDEYLIECITDHRGDRLETLEFKVSWAGYDESEDTWESVEEVKSSTALSSYLENNPELKEIIGNYGDDDDDL
ncbi:hypothetical protein ADUPG1_002491, partial [Aduncisulcus paluster]